MPPPCPSSGHHRNLLLNVIFLLVRLPLSFHLGRPPSLLIRHSSSYGRGVSTWTKLPIPPVKHGFRFSRAIVFVAVSGLIVLCTAFIFLPRRPPALSIVPFSSVEWKKGDPALRGKMAKQVCGLRLLRGRSQQEVLSILGEPDRRTDDRWDYRVDPGTKFVGGTWTSNLVVTYQNHAVANIELRD